MSSKNVHNPTTDGNGKIEAALLSERTPEGAWKALKRQVTLEDCILQLPRHIAERTGMMENSLTYFLNRITSQA